MVRWRVTVAIVASEMIVTASTPTLCCKFPWNLLCGGQHGRMFLAALFSCQRYEIGPVRNLMEGALSGFRRWVSGSCSRTKKVDALFDKAVAETEAVSQEAK